MRTNAGYEIINSFRFDEKHEIVLGRAYSKYSGTRYVTWECLNGDNYFWGHYTEDYLDAYEDFAERIMKHVQELKELRIW